MESRNRAADKHGRHDEERHLLCGLAVEGGEEKGDEMLAIVVGVGCLCLRGTVRGPAIIILPYLSLKYLFILQSYLRIHLGFPRSLFYF